MTNDYSSIVLELDDIDLKDILIKYIEKLYPNAHIIDVADNEIQVVSTNKDIESIKRRI